jgi:hypothetical protein
LAQPSPGGPNYVYDQVNKIPYVWKMENWAGGKVPVFTDLGNLKNANPLLTNAVATSWAIQAWDQWNNVPTSTFRAHVVGDVSLLGLTDITTANVAQVYPAFNGGGVTVVYDADGTIFKNYLGIPGILGVSMMDFAVPNSNEILEGTVFINGSTAVTNDTTGAGIAGVMTHEFGHALNLAHSQANGAVFNLNVQDTPFPYGCTNQPYPGGPGVGPNNHQIETMYPFLDQKIPSGTSIDQFTVDRLDDIAAISDLYPAPGLAGELRDHQGDHQPAPLDQRARHRPHAAGHGGQHHRAKSRRPVQRLHVHRLRRVDARLDRAGRNLRVSRPHAGGNDGVFQSVSLADDLATDNDNRILATTIGSVNADDLLSLVRRAVQGSWVENCRMWDTDEGPTCGGAHDPISRRAPARTTNPLPTSVGTHRIGVK